LGTGYTGPHYKILTGIYREILFGLIKPIEVLIEGYTDDSLYRTPNGLVDHNTNCKTYSITTLKRP
jgi:hypothetical protein